MASVSFYAPVNKLVPLSYTIHVLTSISNTTPGRPTATAHFCLPRREPTRHVRGPARGTGQSHRREAGQLTYAALWRVFYTGLRVTPPPPPRHDSRRRRQPNARPNHYTHDARYRGQRIYDKCSPDRPKCIGLSAAIGVQNDRCKNVT